MRRVYLLAMLLTCLCRPLVAAPPMPPEPWPEWGEGLVEIAVDGKARAIVVVAENPTRAAQVAAAEFIHYVEKLTGARLELVVDAAAPRYNWSPRRILIGESSLTRPMG